MDITVYLPDAVGREAKDAELPLSRMLRAAVKSELTRRAKMAATTGTDMHEIRIETEDDHDEVVIGRFTGRVLAQDDADTVYLTEDDRFILWDGTRHWTTAELDDLEGLLDGKAELQAKVRRALGHRPVIDL